MSDTLTHDKLFEGDNGTRYLR